MRKEDYIVIQGWMLDLALTDKQLRLYAIIWGYSRDGHSRMRATAKHIAEWCKCGPRHAQELIRQLEDMGLIAHEVVTTAKGLVSEFWAVPPETAEPAPTGAKTKIRWAGKGQKKGRKKDAKRDEGYEPQAVTPYEPQAVTPYEPQTVTPIVGSNINKNTTSTKSNNNNSREDAPASAGEFVPPTIDEVTAYAKEQGFADPAGFADYYVRYQTEAKWMTGKGSKRHQISNWKLNVIQWSQYRKNQVFSQPERERARGEAPARKRVVPVSPEEYASLFQ